MKIDWRELAKAPQKWSEFIVLGGLNLVFVPVSIVSVFLLGVGVFYLGKAVFCAFAGPHDAVATAVRGVEFLLLAPLGFFVVDGLLRYTSALSEHITGSKPTPHDERQARRQLLVAKGFTVSFLAAAVAAALVGGVLSPSGLTVPQAAAGGLVLLGLLGLLFLLDHASATCTADAHNQDKGGPKQLAAGVIDPHANK